MLSAAETDRQMGDNDEIEPRWQKWILENLLSGCSAASLELAISKGSDTITNKQAIVAELHRMSRSYYLSAAKEMMHTLDKRNWLLDVCDKLARLDARYARSIEKRATPAFSDFVKEYYSKHLPVVLTEGFDHWPARTLWCPEYFEQRIGDRQVEVQFGRSQDPRYERHSPRYKKKMRMDEFCRLLVAGGNSNDYYLTANNSHANLSAFESLFDDVGNFGDGYRTSGSMTPQSHLWFGPSGVFTPLHHDLTNNMLVQIHGRKKLTLLPALQIPNLYNDHHVYSAAEFPDVDLERFPNMVRVTPIHVVLNPGDAVFIPIGWWHCVEGLDVSISVSFTDFKARNDFFNSYPK